jgi:hypothetical protein
MKLRSAFEDLTATTLTAVSSLWASLEYLAGLRTQQGYSHWGLTRVHGEKSAQDALTSAHKSMLSKVLRSPLHELQQDATNAGAVQGLTGEAYLTKLSEGLPGLLPEKPPAAAQRHLSSVLFALLALRRSRNGATPPIA